MSATDFYIMLGCVIASVAVILFVLLALARKITRNDSRLREEDDFFDYR